MEAAEHKDPKVAIVHLARCANGDAALRAFLHSYSELSPGIEHDLVVVLKGYEQDFRSKALALEALLPHRALTVAIPDEGLDLDAYRTAVNTFSYSYYCFVNSFSQPTCEGWLRQLMHWAEQPNVGIVGATGSYQSILTDDVDALKHIFVRHLEKAFTKARTESRSVAQSSRPPASGRFLRLTGFYLSHLNKCSHSFRHFASFPNIHVRTNGFILSRQVISRLHWPPTTTKSSAYALESGRRGITAQVMRLGLDAVVVGRNGRGYFHQEWPGSGTFWQGNQNNLLIRDNQTLDYELGSADRRRQLCRHAWRDFSTPNVQQGST